MYAYANIQTYHTALNHCSKVWCRCRSYIKDLARSRKYTCPSWKTKGNHPFLPDSDMERKWFHEFSYFPSCWVECMKVVGACRTRWTTWPESVQSTRQGRANFARDFLGLGLVSLNWLLHAATDWRDILTYSLDQATSCLKTTIWYSHCSAARVPNFKSSQLGQSGDSGTFRLPWLQESTRLKNQRGAYFLLR